MQKIYFYHLNIITQELKIDEYELERISPNYLGYTLTISKNNYRRIIQRIKDPNQINLERNGIHVSCYTYHKDKLNEFKALAVNYIIDYKIKCEETIKSMQAAINNCNKSLEKLKIGNN